MAKVELSRSPAFYGRAISYLFTVKKASLLLKAVKIPIPLLMLVAGSLRSRVS